MSLYTKRNIPFRRRSQNGRGPIRDMHKGDVTSVVAKLSHDRH